LLCVGVHDLFAAALCKRAGGVPPVSPQLIPLIPTDLV
jgi:hypothetical protein